MYRLIYLTLIFLVIFLSSNNEVLADIYFVGERQDTNEIRSLVGTYNQLDAEKDRELRESIKGFLIKKIENENIRAENAKQVISWANHSGKTTFWVAHFLLAFGLLASTIEMIHAWRLRFRHKKDSFEVEVGAEKIALKSTMYGILILFLSFLFYFMYIKYVYPVVAVATVQSQESPDQSITDTAPSTPSNISPPFSSR